MVLVLKSTLWTIGLYTISLLYNTVWVRCQNDVRENDQSFQDGKFTQRNYNLEDFFWTGSGDGPIVDYYVYNDTVPTTISVQTSSLESWRTTTVFHTTTILFATIYPNQLGCKEYDCISEIVPVQTNSIDSLPAASPSVLFGLRPSPTFTIPQFSATNSSDVFFNINATGLAIGNSNTTIPTSTPKLTTIKDIPVPHPGFVQENNKIGESISTTTVFPEIYNNQKYWLLTILKNDSHLPNININLTEIKLAGLYRQAFHRREEKYFSAEDFRQQKNRKFSEFVQAHIVNITQVGNDVGLVYSITVAGKPVLAVNAAKDMRLMTASEVIAELGHPVLTKAEPFVNGPAPYGARIKGRARDTWLLLGSAIAAIFLLMLLVGLFALILSTKQPKKGTAQIKEKEGTSNPGFAEDYDIKVENTRERVQSASANIADPRRKNENFEGITVKFKDERRESLTSSSCSGSSELELVKHRQQQIKRSRRRDDNKEQPKPKPRARGRRIQSSDINDSAKYKRCGLSADSKKSKNTLEDSIIEEYSPHQTRSPTSYLSMPSVKAFPRVTKIPEPLNKILEPTIIRHLDADSDSQKECKRCIRTRHKDIEAEEVCENDSKSVRGKVLTRHASLEGDDPGFIGPVVWNKYSRKIFEKDAGILNEGNYDNVNIARMRKRFNELLDDAFSMFGSPEGSEMAPATQLDSRVHSAILRPALQIGESTSCRPSTTGSKRPQSSTISGPKGAWETPSCSTLCRPLSASIFNETTPSIDKNLIYVNSELSPNDPAIPLIAAIKSELKKFDELACNKDPEQFE